MKNTNINKAAFWPALICLAVLVGAGVFATDALGSLLNTILYGMADRAGWFFELFAIICVILTFVLALKRRYFHEQRGSCECLCCCKKAS